MSYNARNYTKQGGDVTVIGGTLEFGPEAKVTGFPAATKKEVGGVKAVDNIANCTASDVEGINAFINNTLLVALRDAGILKD